MSRTRARADCPRGSSWCPRRDGPTPHTPSPRRWRRRRPPAYPLATPSSMLLETPSAHDAWPAAVTGIKPMRVAGDAPRGGSRANSGKVRYWGHEHIHRVVVIGASSLEPLHIPAVGEGDVVARHDR